jgi:hypothetical protein
VDAFLTLGLCVMAYCAVHPSNESTAQCAIAPRRAVLELVDGAGAMAIAPYVIWHRL